MSFYTLSRSKENQNIIKNSPRILNNNEARLEYCDNRISTSKYTILTFFPINIFEQFSKIANLYFLIIGLLQMIKAISISGGQPVIYMPLVVVIAISALKDIFEDLKRHKSDKQENNRICTVYRDGELKEAQQNTLRVGEIIMVQAEETIPADIIPIYSSESKGICFIETKNLDGETNLKRKIVPPSLQKLQLYRSNENINKEFYNKNFKAIQNQNNSNQQQQNINLQNQEYQDIQLDSQQKQGKNVYNNNIKFCIETEPPNVYLYQFKGALFFKSNSEKIPLDQNNLILRGCTLQNTEMILGMICYTGHDSKIMLNSERAKPKKSNVEKKMNIYICLLFALQLAICLTTSLIATSWFLSNEDQLSYLELDPNSESDTSFTFNFFVKWGTWILIFTNFVPISLLVTIEMVKFIQGIIISNDPNTESKIFGIQTSVQCSGLNEELGQVNYILSDKTGTLTCNVMKYKYLTVNGVNYGDQRNMRPDILKQLSFIQNVDFQDQSLFDTLNDQNNSNFPYLQEILLMLTLCHTVVIDKNKIGLTRVDSKRKSNGLDEEQNNNNNNENFSNVMKNQTQKTQNTIKSNFLLNQEEENSIKYNASSPDELALLNFARFCGALYLGIDEQNIISVKFLGQIYKFILLNVIEFSSFRKRMSVIVKDCRSGRIILYTKGADTVIEQRLQKISQEQIKKKNENSIKEETWKNLTNYACKGLRTLILAKRNIDSEYYNEWNKQYQVACSSLEDRESKMDAVVNQIECDLTLMGATAIEDMLQSNVGETISLFKQAGIKVWMLTGDKMETAINIGYSCSLLQGDVYRIIIDCTTQEEAQNILENQLIMVQQRQQQDKTYQQQPPALVITGDALIHCMKIEKLTKQLILISNYCQVVIACRVSPKQKQEIVLLIKKEHKDAITLAIGDGANDVNMITAAHVGIGIKGLEGQQAARASDYSIGEFKILQHLLFYHGRECYRRNSALICYNFYKNMILVLPQWWYSFSNQLSGVSLYDPWIYQFYNLFYTSLPIVVYALFDEEYSSQYLTNNPVYYVQGIKNELFNTKEYFSQIFIGIFQAALCAWIAFGSLESTYLTSGYVLYFASTGMASFAFSVLIGNLKILLISNTFTIMMLFVVFGSIAFYISNHAIISVVSISSQSYNTFSSQYSQGFFWFGVFNLIGLTVMIEMAYLRWKNLTKQKQIKQEIKNKESFINQLELSQINLNASQNKSARSNSFQSNNNIISSQYRHTGFAFSQEDPMNQNIPRLLE